MNFTIINLSQVCLVITVLICYIVFVTLFTPHVPQRYFYVYRETIYLLYLNNRVVFWVQSPGLHH